LLQVEKGGMFLGARANREATPEALKSQVPFLCQTNTFAKQGTKFFSICPEKLKNRATQPSSLWPPTLCPTDTLEAYFALPNEQNPS
jgi:hypothetical protein